MKTISEKGRKSSRCRAANGAFVLGIFLFPLVVSATTLRLEGDRAWLDADGAPLSKVLKLFEQRGVAVLIDPSLDLGRVSGQWENTKIDRLIDQLASPHSYLIEHKRISGPLGELYQLSAIRIYSDGNLSAARPLSAGGRVLDVIEGPDGTKYVRSEIMIGFEEGATVADLKALLEKLGGTVIEVIDPPGLYRIKLNEGMSVEAAMAIADTDDKVESSEPNLAFSSSANPAVPISGTQAGMNLNLVPGETAIAVFDSGLDPKYADLPYIRGTYNALDPTADMTDPTGHGTLVSLIASGAITPLGAEASEVGVPILVVRVFDENGMTSSDIILGAINYAIGSDVKIINLSFGTYEDIGFIEHAVQYAAQQGVTIFVASGNDGLNIAANPAASPATISVGATDQHGNVASYSNTEANIYAPGSAMYDGRIHHGTSFASPFAAHEFAVQK
jgi:hypothetical protein